MKLPPPKNKTVAAATNTTTTNAGRKEAKPFQLSLPFDSSSASTTTTTSSSLTIKSSPNDLIPTGPNSSLMRSDVIVPPSGLSTEDRLDDIVHKKVLAANPLTNTLALAEPKNQVSKFIKINSEINAFTGQSSQDRIVRLVEKAVDPLEPAKFRFRAVPKGPGDPPVPILHSPTKRATEQERKDWEIPTAVSNWNNTRGFVVSLDKRLAQNQVIDSIPMVNDKFGKLADSLFSAEDVSRTMVEQRFLQRQQAEESKQQAENEALRIQAMEARAMRQQQQQQQSLSSSSQHQQEPDRFDRDRVRQERKRELDRELKLQQSGKRTQMEREESRDISERIALGQPIKSNAAGGVEFDQRLFAREATAHGLGSGLGAEDEDNVYSTSLFGDKRSDSSYKPSQALRESKTAVDMAKRLDELKSSSVVFEKQEDLFLSSTNRGTVGKSLDKIGTAPAFGLSSGRFSAMPSSTATNNRRFEDKEDEEELKQELELKKQQMKESKKKKMSFVPGES